MAITNTADKSLDWIREAKEILEQNFARNPHPNQEAFQAICQEINSIPGHHSENLPKKIENWFEKERVRQKSMSVKEEFIENVDTSNSVATIDESLPKGKLLMREYFPGKDVTNNEEMKQRSSKMRKLDSSGRKESMEPNIAYVTEQVTVIHQQDFGNDRMKENEEQVIDEEQVQEEEIEDEDDSINMENTYDETIHDSTSSPEKHFQNGMAIEVVTQENMVLPLTPIDDNDDKMNRKRQRNRMAATKCRQRKINRIAYLEEEVRGLSESLEERKNRKSELENQIIEVQAQIQDYVDQGHTWMQQFL